VTIRPLVRADRAPLETILVETGVFSTDEVGIALELIDVALDRREQKDYLIYTAVADDEEVVGYICIGPTPATHGTYDLYWIAVKPGVHGSGVGKALLGHAERLVRSWGGRLLVAETSSRGSYDGTRMFYQRTQFVEAARIKDYYSVGDDLVVYAKYLS
jgi:ribosomal protein S18 acetylase RimI-like enzyme